MKIKTSLLLYILCFHLLAAGFCLYAFWDNRIFLLPAEIVLAVSFSAGFFLVNRLTTPIESLQTGIDLIQSKDFSITFIETKQQELNRLIKLYNSMVIHLREERVELEEKNLFLAKLIQSSPSGIIIFDFDQRVLSINPSALQLLGLTEAAITGKSLSEINIPFAAELLTVSETDARIITLPNQRKIRTRKSHFLNKGFLQNFILLEELTEEFRLAEKQAYEKLIRMMSHEVNNTVGAVNSLLSSSLQLKSVIPPEHIPDFTIALETAISRNQRLNIFMKGFADVIKIPKPVLRQYDIIRLLDGVSDLFHRQLLDRNISLQWSSRPAYCINTFDYTQLEQVFINLFKNAIEAIDNNGIISLSVNTQTPATLISITDSGCGLSEEQQNQLFVPFYTTKENGQGIGLTMSHEILSNHKMKISCTSKPGGPTTFTVQF